MMKGIKPVALTSRSGEPIMILRQPPQPVNHFLQRLSSLLDKRHADLVTPLFLGELLAHGRRTATAWFRAGGIADEFKRAYPLLGTLGRSKIEPCASLLFADARHTIDPGPRWLLALDDTPTQRYGPHVEGAGLHHNPTPGPAEQKFLYGHLWVTVAWVVRHPRWGALGLPVRAVLYVRQQQIGLLRVLYGVAFQTKLE